MHWAKPIKELVDRLPVMYSSSAGGIVINDIVDDTRDITPGCLFVARSGGRFNSRDLIPEAQDRGAAIILSDPRSCQAASIPTLSAENPTAVGIQIADRLFEYPFRQLPVIAVTGTNGKTTTATCLQHLLGPLAGLIGSIEIDDTLERTPSRLTTPGPMLLRRSMARMITNGCRYVVMEASSHGIALGRMHGLHLAGAIMTNLSGDHLDFHGTMERYLGAKRALFSTLASNAFAVINMDDPAGAVMAAATRARVISCRMKTTGPADIRVRTCADGHLHLQSDEGVITCRQMMPGEHNAMNTAQAYAAAQAVGEQPDRTRLESMPTPRGRLERVSAEGRGSRIYIDFAHTDAAIQTALEALRPLASNHGRLIVVFGCGGDRDRSKRSRMGFVASRLADRVVVTSDNPRSESPMSIIEDVLAGIPNRDRVDVESDRALAIEKAIGMADEGDVVLIAGKGHEAVQLIGDRSLPFDDREVALGILGRLSST